MLTHVSCSDAQHECPTSPCALPAFRCGGCCIHQTLCAARLTRLLCAQVNVSTDPARTVDITEGDSVIVDFTYAVKWRETTVPFERRMDKYSRYSFLPQHLEARTPQACHLAGLRRIGLQVLSFSMSWP